MFGENGGEYIMGFGNTIQPGKASGIDGVRFHEKKVEGKSTDDA